MTPQPTAARVDVPHDPSPVDLDRVRTSIDGALADFLSTATAHLSELGQELDEVGAAIRQFSVGGKRIRPLFTYAGWLAAGCGQVSERSAVRAGGSLELVQVAALVHDDIIDKSDTRRGRPSVHAEFGALHRAAGWVGSGHDFGVSAGILIGDLGLIWADAMLASAELPPPVLTRVRTVFDLMRVEVIAGQYLDVHITAAPTQGADALESALRVARLKSASYTVARPLQMGGTLAGADPTVLGAFHDYGLALGEAFQLRDDLLGVYGDPRQTGKPTGDDLREGKRTALLAMTEMKVRTPRDRAVVARAGAADLEPDEIATIADLIRSCGAVDDVEQLISARVTRACAALDSVTLHPRGRDALDQLTVLATSRAT